MLVWGLVASVFLGMKGWSAVFCFFLKNTITHLICRLAPFWEHKGGTGPFWKNPRINSEMLHYALSGLEVIKHFMLNLNEHEISTAHKN